MDIKRKVTSVSKALGITALVLGYGTYCIAKKVVKESKEAMILSKEVYREAKSKLDYVEDIDQQAFAQGRESSYS